MIEDKLSDQGPWGGSRWIHWVAHDAETFTPADAMKFAAEHGWKCGEVVEYSAERMRCWKSLASRPVFPLFFGEPTATALNLNHEFPRHIEGDCFIIQCETGWIRVAPGTGKESPAFGYIQVSKDGKRMAIYHLWGEV
jgi:hypothetical protein